MSIFSFIGQQIVDAVATPGTRAARVINALRGAGSPYRRIALDAGLHEEIRSLNDAARSAEDLRQRMNDAAPGHAQLSAERDRVKENLAALEGQLDVMEQVRSHTEAAMNDSIKTADAMAKVIEDAIGPPDGTGTAAAVRAAAVAEARGAAGLNGGRRRTRKRRKRRTRRRKRRRRTSKRRRKKRKKTRRRRRHKKKHRRRRIRRKRRTRRQRGGANCPDCGSCPVCDHAIPPCIMRTVPIALPVAAPRARPQPPVPGGGIEAGEFGGGGGGGVGGAAQTQCPPHDYERTGGNYAADLSFFRCRKCGHTKIQ